MQNWEYQTLEFETKGVMGGLLSREEFDAALYRCGNEGWELVSCFTTNQGQGATRKVFAVFKRPKGV